MNASPATAVDAAACDARLAAALPPGALHAVGGRVRDEIRATIDGVARPAKDLDYVVVGIGLDELVRRLSTVGRADVVGASFAVVKVTIDGVTVDVSLPRREISTGVGHREFDVHAGPDVTLAEDLARRDFRMNMIARRLPDGETIDPYDGESDIRAGFVRLLRAEAFVEDPLRMLRACQFAARFGFTIAPETVAAMRAAAPLVKTVAPERVRDELLKFLSGADRPSRGIEAMREGGLLPYVLPEVAEGIGVEQNIFHAYDVYGHALATLDAAPLGDGVVRWAALLHDVGKPRVKDGPHFYRHEVVGAEMTACICERLRFAHDDAAAVERLVRNHMYAADPTQEDRTLRRFIRRIGPDLLDRQFALRAADILGSGLPKHGPENEQFQARVRAIVHTKPALTVRDLAIDGKMVIDVLIRLNVLAAGSRGGPEVGVFLSALLERVIDDPELNDLPTLRSLIEELAVAVPVRGSAEVSRETEPRSDRGARGDASTARGP